MFDLLIFDFLIYDLSGDRNNSRNHRSKNQTSYFYYFRSTDPVMQGFAEEGNEKEINNGYTCQTAKEYSPNGSSGALQIYDFGITEPFGWCSLKDDLKEAVVYKHGSKEDPAKIEIRVSPVAYIESPALVDGKCQNEDDQCIDEEIQYSCTFSYFSHEAKVVRGEK